MMFKPQWANVTDGNADIDLDSQVHAALLTTYEPPDGDFLVEEIFPSWFQLDGKKSSDDDTSFAPQVRVMEALKARHGRIAIFSSSAIQGESSQHWIWPQLGRYTVGAKGPVTQHAKLWLLHRIRGDGSEWLDVRISSTNLTRQALDGQLQSGIRICAFVGSKPSSANLESWGVLEKFLKALGWHSTQDQPVVERFLRLLRRSVAPAHLELIGSIPGEHANAVWGARSLGAALGSLGKGGADILVPTIGQWQPRDLLTWCKVVGVSPRDVRLAWIGDKHGWASKWAMPKVALHTIKKVGVQLVAAPADDGFPREKLHEQFKENDKRWPHAKIYWFGKGQRNRALVTSANWSVSAWGKEEKGKLRIENFELGVLFPVASRPLAKAPRLSKTPAVLDEGERTERSSIWAHATFDGKRLAIALRTDRGPPAKLIIANADQVRELSTPGWNRSSELWNATVVRKWIVPPSFLAFTFSDGIEHWVSVQDIRDQEAAWDQPLSRPPGLSVEELRRVQAALLEERYGGAPVEGDEIGKRGKGGRRSIRNGVHGSYAMQSLEVGRRLAALVDEWVNALNKATNAEVRDAVKRDGRKLVEAWRTESKEGGMRAVALPIAADDLAARLKAAP